MASAREASKRYAFREQMEKKIAPPLKGLQ